MFRYLTLSLYFALLFAGCSTSSEPEIINYIPCEDGNAVVENDSVVSYPCDNVDFYAHLSLVDLMAETEDGVEASLNDIWGWIDPETGREYALVGLTDGVTFVDVTEPWEPVVVGKLNEPPAGTSKENPLMAKHDDEEGKGASDWRDVKVYEDYMYVVSEQSEHGLQVFDLTRLRDVQNPPQEFQEDYIYDRFGNAHNLAINEQSGYAYAVGSTRGGDICSSNGGLHMINLHDNPVQPVYAGCHVDEEAGGVVRDGYIHDTQCVIYAGPDDQYSGQEICFSSAEQTFLISDVEDKENPATISNSSYSGVQYSHQGWLSEDHAYFFMNDELDERRTHNPTRTYVWDLQNLEEPEMIGYYEHSTSTIDHNLYVKGDLMYQANYTSGLRVLDVSNPHPNDITTLGFFDTTPNDNTLEFAGLWSVYPYLSGDKVVVSDMNNGLFILRYSP